MSNAATLDKSRLAIFVGLLLAFALGTLFQSRVGGGVSPTPLPTYTALPTHTAYPTYTPPPTDSPTATLTVTPSPTATNTPTSTSTATPTNTATDTPTNTPTHTPTATPTSTPTNTPIPPSRILTGIRESGQLITIKAEMALVGLEVRYRANRACEYSAKHAAAGVIEAGVNLEAISRDSIRCDNILCTSYTITLPAPEISSCRIEYLDQYIQEGGGTVTCFANDWMDMEDIARGLSVEQFLNEALIEDDILGQAGDQATLVLGNLIRELTGSQVHIKYAEVVNESIVPDSCRPELPPGWDIDAEGKWRKTG